MSQPLSCIRTAGRHSCMVPDKVLSRTEQLPRQLLRCHPLRVFPPSYLMAPLSLDRLPNKSPAPKSLCHALLLEEPQMGRQQLPL